ncbi:SIMPL domain-containing protein [Flavobacterium suaedae]|nr:SIMPL domain-containing protein [Flavobacterium suaedae]
MKTIKSSIALAFCLANLFSANAQEMGNVNYGSNRYQNQNQRMNSIASNNENYMSFTVRGIYNQKPAGYAATFAIVQVGTSVEEVNALMNEKIDAIKEKIKAVDPEIEVITDMISFVPKYEYEVTKKLFSKKTYNEKPAGFELKKNLIIKYKKRVLDEIMTACAEQEIYDLVKVDYIITNLESIREKLETKMMTAFETKMNYYSKLSGIDLKSKPRNVSESYNLMYPTESYSSYSAFSRTQLPYEKNRVVNNTEKNVSYYYNPVVPKNHTFVVNPEVIEPCVQVFYDFTITIDLRKPEKEVKTETKTIEKKSVFIITHDGDVKPLQF